MGPHWQTNSTNQKMQKRIPLADTRYEEHILDQKHSQANGGLLLPCQMLNSYFIFPLHQVIRYFNVLWFPSLRIMIIRIVTFSTVFMAQQCKTSELIKIAGMPELYKRLEITKLKNSNSVSLCLSSSHSCIRIKILYSRFQWQIFKFLSGKFLEFLLVRTRNFFFLLPADLSNA